MTSNATHNKGAILQSVNESTYGVDPGSGYYDMRIDGEPEITGQFTKFLQPETLQANPNETEKPVLVDVGVEGAIKLRHGITRAASAGSDAGLVNEFKSGGWVEDSGSDTTVDTATSQTSIVLAAAEGAAGRMSVVELDDGRYWPALVSSVSGATVTFACGLPSVTGVGNAFNQCHTLTPGALGVSAVSMTKRHITKAKNSTNNVMGVFTGVALSEIGTLEIEPGTIPYLDLTYNVANHYVENLAGGLPANSFLDGPGKKPIDGTWVQFANANASGAIATATVKLLSASINMGGTTVQIPGIGDAECINNTQGNRQDLGMYDATLKFLYPADRITDWEGTNPSKYIGIVQPSLNTTQPPFAFIWPNAHISEDPVWTTSGDDNMHIVEIKYKGNPAGYNSETLESDQGNQPFYFGLGTESA